MDRHVFIAKYPRLYHLAADGAWPSIKEHGLLSAEALTKRSELPADERDRLLSERRETVVSLAIADFGPVVLRDQGPLNEKKLATSLTGGMTVPEWLRLLNNYVFLFPDREPLAALQAKYGDEPVVLIELTTSRLLDRYDSLLRVTGINTGSTAFAARGRGRESFQSVAMFSASRKVKEVAVEHGIPDLSRYLVKAQRVHPDGSAEQLS